jgi:hypothetical protein
VLLAIFLISVLSLRVILWYDARKRRKRASADLSGLPFKESAAPMTGPEANPSGFSSSADGVPEQTKMDPIPSQH